MQLHAAIDTKCPVSTLVHQHRSGRHTNAVERVHYESQRHTSPGHIFDLMLVLVARIKYYCSISLIA
jgi:hypothetical protein